MHPSIRRFLATFLLLSAAAGAFAAVDRTDVVRRLEALPAAHPRLLLNAASEAALKQRLAQEPMLQVIQAGIVSEADRQLTTKPVERVLIGRRLLDKSRTALSRIVHLGLAWRLTGKEAYLQRAREELVAVTGFTDWNPSHFLDVAEMTMAVGLGYDWLYSGLDEPTRARLRTALIEKGLRTSIKTSGWSKQTNNWNQVCNAGMTVGALAVAETDRELAADMIVRAVNTVPISMHEFAPDGAYPEGPGYWGYGTTFNVVLISALESTLGTDFGLSALPGFLATADYYLHVIGPSGYYFNYSDAGRGGQGVSAAMFWFAARRQAPYLLWHDWAALESQRTSRGGRGRDRLDPLMLLWLAPQQAAPTAPPALSWSGGGPTPVAFHRSSWDRNASFVAIKGGSPSNSHAHMDVGTFVMDALGQRWADDLGMQDYNSLESKGVDLWNRKQDSPRWKVFRIGAASHNVLQFGGQAQVVAGKAPIVVTKPGRTVVDLADVYAGQVAAARRGVVLQTDGSVRVQDEFTTLAQATPVRWAIVTRANVTLGPAGEATLTQGGKQLVLRVLEPAGARLAIFPTDPPPSPLDARNPDTRMVGFESNAAPQAAQRLIVELVPAGAPATRPPVTPLAAW